MKSLSLFLPIRYFFGKGIFEEKLKEIIPILGENILLVTGKNFARKYGYLDKIESIFKELKINFIHFDGISQNPKTFEIEDAVKIARSEKVNSILGFGGGSVMDAVKAISLLVKNEGRIWDYTMMQKSPKNEALNFCLVPTTFATGSELNSTSIISNQEEKRKWGIFDEKIFPKFSIVDPLISLSLDKEYLSLCSIDIITHMLEPFVTSKEEGEVIKGVAKFYIKKTIESIKILIKDPQNISARENLHLLSGFSLIGIATRGIGGFHEMHWLEHIVSGFYDNVPHPAGLSILLVPWIKYRWNKNTSNLKELFSFLMEKDEVDLNDILSYLDDFYNEINLPRSFKKYGIKEVDIEDFVREYNFLTENFKRFFPEKIKEKDLFNIFKEALL
ncbi:MAG: iron-containing alcohol dehydrogenase [Candidatus Hydrothermales bacterium]